MIDTRKVIECLEEMVTNTSICFRTHNTRLIDKVKNDSIILQKKIKEIRDEQYIDYIENSRQNLDRLLSALDTKISGGILFSDAAVKEMNTLFEELVAFLDHLKDYLLTGNPVLRGHIKQVAAENAQLARDFATKHEERLIQGVCQPRSSTIYLDMLNGISAIFYNLSRIAA